MAADLASDDPFSGSSIFSLFHHAVDLPPEAVAVTAADGELKSVEGFITSKTASAASKELLEQAQTITKRHMNCANFNLDDHDGLVVPNGEGLSRNTRPALGLKRTRFSLKPEASQTSRPINANFSTEGIDDLAEYFSVCEHLNNMEKQNKDISMDFLLHQKTLAHRKPRLGISRKSAKYRHISDHDTSEVIVNPAEVSNRRNCSLPEGVYVKDNFCPPNDLLNDSQPREINIHEIPDTDARDGSITHDGTKVLDLLCGLSCHEDLDDEKIQAVLKNLHIQPINLGKTHLPGLFYSQKGSSGSCKSFSVGDDLKNAQFSSSSVALQNSPTSINFVLKKRLSVKNAVTNQLLEDAEMIKHSGVSFPRSEEAIYTTSPGESFDCHETTEMVADNTAATADDERLNLTAKVQSSVSKIDMQIEGSPRARTSQNSLIETLVTGNMVLSNKHTLHSSSSLAKGVAYESGKSNDNISPSVGLDGSIEDVGNDLQENTPKSRQINLGLYASLEKPENNGVQVEDGSKDGEGAEDISNTSERALPTDSPENTCILLEENKGLLSESETVPKRRMKPMPSLKHQRNENSDSDTHIRAKSKLPSMTGQRELKFISRRQSLAGAGTKVCAGVRRSTRIKFRPLEEWRGERFLYGRIHDSLATVIGIKYCSPGSKNFNVKSFVSEEYADLVAHAGKG